MRCKGRICGGRVKVCEVWSGRCVGMRYGCAGVGDVGIHCMWVCEVGWVHTCRCTAVGDMGIHCMWVCEVWVGTYM